MYMWFIGYSTAIDFGHNIGKVRVYNINIRYFLIDQ